MCSIPAGVRSSRMSPSRAFIRARAIGDIQLTWPRSRSAPCLARERSSEPQLGLQRATEKHRPTTSCADRRIRFLSKRFDANDGDRSLRSPLMSIGDGRAKEHLIQVFLLCRVDHLSDFQTMWMRCTLNSCNGRDHPAAGRRGSGTRGNAHTQTEIPFGTRRTTH
jgi:hypothetical protein